MQGSLGEKIGEGATADVHAWAPGLVVKLFKAGIPRRASQWEARVTRAVFAAGGPAPEVVGEVFLEGRYGIVLPHLDGSTLRHLSETGAMNSGQVGLVLAALALSVHNTPPPSGLLSLRDNMEGSLRLSPSALGEPVAAGVLALIDRLLPSDGLCHGDLHSGNVIMTAGGPRLVDWTGAVRAPAGFDLACCHVLHTGLIPERVDDPERPRAIGAAMQAEFARLAGLSPATLTAAMTPYLPIVRARAALGMSAPDLRARLIQRVEAALSSEGLI